MTPIALNWGDMDVNGEPAFRRALQALMHAVNGLESQQLIGLHLMENRVAALERAPAELALEQLAGRLARIEAQLEELTRPGERTTELHTGCGSRRAASPDGVDIAGTGAAGSEMVWGPVVWWDGHPVAFSGEDEMPKEWRNDTGNGTCAEARRPSDGV